MNASAAFRTVMLALGTPTGELDAAWKAAEHHDVTAEELAAAKRLIARMMAVPKGEAFDATGDPDAKALARFGKPRPMRHARGNVEISFSTGTLGEIRETSIAIEEARTELARMEAHRMLLMRRAVDDEREQVTTVALAAGITRERYYQLRRASDVAE
ncbi:hypothetical protein ACH3VR_21805 [Microbacterium sp. B2969]|uniref:DUF222 domain-containing protein n=1 Tax=Microbacterium alkaliflavum TaxID=3248839 RepID=A0ABW7QDP3_9MICO